MIFQEIHCDLEVSARWKEHYLFLSGHDDFYLHFSAILSFDITERMCYSINPYAFNKDNYLWHFKAIKLEIMSTTIRNATHDLGQESQSLSSKPHYGSQPYDHEKCSKFCPASMDSASSFHDWDFKGNISHSSPLCLCCKHTRHKFVIAQKAQCQQAFWCTCITSIANSLSVPFHPSFSASPSSLTLPSTNAKLTIPLNTPVHGAGSPIMEPAHKSVSEASMTPQFFLKMPPASASFYRDQASCLFQQPANRTIVLIW